MDQSLMDTEAITDTDTWRRANLMKVIILRIYVYIDGYVYVQPTDKDKRRHSLILTPFFF